VDYPFIFSEGHIAIIPIVNHHSRLFGLAR